MKYTVLLAAFAILGIEAAPLFANCVTGDPVSVIKNP